MSQCCSRHILQFVFRLYIRMIKVKKIKKLKVIPDVNTG